MKKQLKTGYNDDGDGRYFFEAFVQYFKKLHNLHNDLPFFPERMKFEKVEKLVQNFHGKKKHVIHKINLKQALNHGLEHSVIKFNQKALLNPYIDMNTELKKEQKIILKNIFFKIDE